MGKQDSERGVVTVGLPRQPGENDRVNVLAKNTGEGSRAGAVKGRVQALNPVTRRYVKIDTETGRIIDHKKSAGPYKGIREVKPPTPKQKNKVPLIFSPLSEEVLGSPPRGLHPRHAFTMRQINTPPAIDLRMGALIFYIFTARGIETKDADASTGQKDFLERILGIIRDTGFTVAISSRETRGTAMANIALRTDWVEYDANNEAEFKREVGQAVDTIEELAAYEEMLL